MIKFVKVKRDRYVKYAKDKKVKGFYTYKDYCLEFCLKKRVWRWLIVIIGYIPFILVSCITGVMGILMEFILLPPLEWFIDFQEDTRSLIFIGKIVDDEKEEEIKFKIPD